MFIKLLKNPVGCVEYVAYMLIIRVKVSLKQVAIGTEKEYITTVVLQNGEEIECTNKAEDIIAEMMYYIEAHNNE